jgi:periplasmic protein TonB
MHAALGQVGTEGMATWRASFPEPRQQAPVASAPPTVPEQPSTFGGRRQPNWLAIAFIIGAHAVLLFALVKMDVIAIAQPKARPLVVELLTLDPPPPVPPSAPEVTPPDPIAPKIVVPEVVVPTPAPTPPVLVTRDPPPVKAVIVAPPAPSAASAPVSVDDLSSKMVSAPAPRYPVESRRRKEQGTVFLSVLVGTDGSVSEVEVSRSSGFARLDKAALEAVRRWRWSPVMRAGAAVMVRGIVDIPFVLQG